MLDDRAMIELRRASHLGMGLSVLVALCSACTPLESTKVIVSDRDARAEEDEPDGGDDSMTGGSGGTHGGDSGDGSMSGDGGDAGQTPDDDAAMPSGRCEGDGEMVDFEAGDFYRGEATLPETSPPQVVPVGAFAIDRTEVTVVAYEDCVDAGECTAPEPNGWCNWGSRVLRACYPINCVTWDQADAYCAWANKRLPTEDEWEYAARGPDEPRPWPWGGDDPSGLAHFNGNMGTVDVGSFPEGATPEGLLDMSGNVFEWTSSIWCDSYDDEAACDSSLHVGRGGDWETGDFTQLRTHYREAGPTMPDHGYGFRCAK